jgi:hypothetical protein
VCVCARATLTVFTVEFGGYVPLSLAAGHPVVDGEQARSVDFAHEARGTFEKDHGANLARCLITLMGKKPALSAACKATRPRDRDRGGGFRFIR